MYIMAFHIVKKINEQLYTTICIIFKYQAKEVRKKVIPVFLFL